MIKSIRNPYLQLLQYTSAASIKYLGGWYYAVYSSPMRRWFPARNWCVLKGSEVISFLTELSRSKYDELDLI